MTMTFMGLASVTHITCHTLYKHIVWSYVNMGTQVKFYNQEEAEL